MSKRSPLAQAVAKSVKARTDVAILNNIACVDGLTGFADAIEAAFPRTQVQLCIVYMVRNSQRYVSYKDRKAVAADHKLIYTASIEALAEQQLMANAIEMEQAVPDY